MTSNHTENCNDSAALGDHAKHLVVTNTSNCQKLQLKMQSK